MSFRSLMDTDTRVKRAAVVYLKRYASDIAAVAITGILFLSFNTNQTRVFLFAEFDQSQLSWFMAFLFLFGNMTNTFISKLVYLYRKME